MVPPDDDNIDLRVAFEPPTAESLGALHPVAACQDTYEKSCRQLGVIPVSRFVKALGDDEVTVAHFGIGPVGCRGVAEALRMNPPLRSLDLSDNRLTEVGLLDFAAPLPR